MGSGVDLVGRRFGRLLVIRRFEKNDNFKNRQWVCVCDCGNHKIVMSRSLITGATKSCGCLKREGQSEKFYQGIESLKKQKFNNYRTSARDRCIVFGLTLEKFSELVESPCFYCGDFNIVKHMTKHDELFKVNGIDRLDSSKGYVDDNVVSCCGHCNLAKRSLSVDEFLSWARKLVEFQDRRLKNEQK